MATTEEIELLVMRAMACSARVPPCPPAAVVASWERLLGHRDASTLDLALDRIFAAEDRWPTPRRILAELARMDGEAPPSPAEAWAEVVAQMRRVGRYGQPAWSHEAVGRAAVALYGSWQALCERSEDELAFDRAHFLRFYVAFCDRPPRGGGSDLDALEAEVVAALEAPTAGELEAGG